VSRNEFSAISVSVWSLSCISHWPDCHSINTCIYDNLVDVCVCVCVCVCLSVCVCVCPHNNLKTIAYVYFLIASCVDWRKVSSEFACRCQAQGQGHFSGVQGHSIRLWAVLSRVVRFHLRWLHFQLEHISIWLQNIALGTSGEDRNAAT